MSLRDQLLAKGLVSKKDAQKANRDLKKKRKQKQSKREKRRIAEARQAATRADERQADIDRRLSGRKQREKVKEVDGRALQIRQMISSNRIGHNGRTVFHFKKLGGRKIGRLEVSDKVAWMLRCGEAAIAGYLSGQGEVYAVIGAKTAKKLLQIGPEHLVFFTQNTAGISAADEAFLVRKWEMSLTPRRVTLTEEAAKE